LPAAPEARRFWLGRLGGEVADEVVVAVKRERPVPWLEVHGHGGREVVRFLLEQFQAHGLEVWGWEDFLRRTGDDPLSSEAAVELTRALTLRTAAILLDQQQGALGRALEAVLAALDHGDTASAEAWLSELVRQARVGGHLTRPWRVVVAGAPNVGKSSLVNALAGYQRSVVAETPGTTRDVVTTQVALDGWPVELADTAGLRPGAPALEEQGIRLAEAEAAGADLCLWVLDLSSEAEPVWPTLPPAAVQLVLNKIDLPPVRDAGPTTGAVRVSAKTGEGLAALCEAVASRLVPEPPPAGAAVPFTPRFREGVGGARRLLLAGSVADARRLLASLRDTKD
jgi:tRNA modification GTPase